MMPVDAPTELVELHRALVTLPARQRVVLVLRYFHDLPDTEIASVRTRIFSPSASAG